MKLTDVIDSEAQRVLAYGPPKSGKTELVGTLTSQFDLHYFDLENGYKTLRKLPMEQQERINLFRIPDTKEYPIAVETMLKVIKGTKTSICDTHGKVDCMLCKKDAAATFSTIELNALDVKKDIVVVDSLTQLSNSVMNHLTKGKEDTYKPEWTDYRNQGQLLDKFLSQIQQSRFNIVCITHETETQMEDGKAKLVPVAGTREFSRNTAKYFDHVIYCDIKNKKHIAASSSTYQANILTGSRLGIELETGTGNGLLDIFTGAVTTTRSTTPAHNAVAHLKTLQAGQGEKK